MPRRVDHEARRALVADAAGDLVAERGLDAVTFREIAERTGFSTAIVSHYFTDKRHVLGVTYRASVRRARARFEQARERYPADAARAIDALLPLDAASRRDWKVWFAFWAQAAADEELAGEQRRRVRLTRTDIAEVLPATGRDGRPVDGAEAARHLLSAIMGIAAQAVFDPRDWTTRRQRQAVRDLLDALGYEVTQL